MKTGAFVSFFFLYVDGISKKGKLLSLIELLNYNTVVKGYRIYFSFKRKVSYQSIKRLLLYITNHT